MLTCVCVCVYLLCNLYTYESVCFMCVCMSYSKVHETSSSAYLNYRVCFLCISRFSSFIGLHGKKIDLRDIVVKNSDICLFNHLTKFKYFEKIMLVTFLLSQTLDKQTLDTTLDLIKTRYNIP